MHRIARRRNAARFYDMGFISFSGTMGIFLIGLVVWGVAIILDRNAVLPRRFGYFNIFNALTEVVVATCVIVKEGPFAYNGPISFYINMVVFGIYTGVFITYLKRMIEHEDPARGGVSPMRTALSRTALSPRAQSPIQAATT